MFRRDVLKIRNLYLEFIDGDLQIYFNDAESIKENELIINPFDSNYNKEHAYLLRRSDEVWSIDEETYLKMFENDIWYDEIYKRRCFLKIVKGENFTLDFLNIIRTSFMTVMDFYTEIFKKRNASFRALVEYCFKNKEDFIVDAHPINEYEVYCDILKKVYGEGGCSTLLGEVQIVLHAKKILLFLHNATIASFGDYIHFESLVYPAKPLEEKEMNLKENMMSFEEKKDCEKEKAIKGLKMFNDTFSNGFEPGKVYDTELVMEPKGFYIKNSDLFDYGVDMKYSPSTGFTTHVGLENGKHVMVTGKAPSEILLEGRGKIVNGIYIPTAEICEEGNKKEVKVVINGEYKKTVEIPVVNNIDTEDDNCNMLNNTAIDYLNGDLENNKYIKAVCVPIEGVDSGKYSIEDILTHGLSFNNIAAFENKTTKKKENDKLDLVSSVFDDEDFSEFEEEEEYDYVCENCLEPLTESTYENNEGYCNECVNKLDYVCEDCGCGITMDIYTKNTGYCNECEYKYCKECGEELDEDGDCPDCDYDDYEEDDDTYEVPALDNYPKAKTVPPLSNYPKSKTVSALSNHPTSKKMALVQDNLTVSYDKYFNNKKIVGVNIRTIDELNLFKNKCKSKGKETNHINATFWHIHGSDTIYFNDDDLGTKGSKKNYVVVKLEDLLNE